MASNGEPTEIGIVLYPGAQLSAIHGLTDLFSIANRYATHTAPSLAPPLAVRHWTFDPEDHTVTGADRREHTSARQFDILILPPTMVDLPATETRVQLARWLSDQHVGGVRLVSICSGVALLAESGLLNGRTVSTHRNFAGYLAEHFPDVIVDLDERIIEYPDILTAGGFMSWVDVGLLLVERLLGGRIREETARFMIHDPDAPEKIGVQDFIPPSAHGDAAVRQAQQLVHLRDGRDVSLQEMAAAAGLERRTFIRRFVDATGTAPVAYAREVRIARAAELLDAGKLSQKEIAERLGYIDVSSFSRAFRRSRGMSPGAYRRRHHGPHFGDAGRARPGPAVPVGSPHGVPAPDIYSPRSDGEPHHAQEILPAGTG